MAEIEATLQEYYNSKELLERQAESLPKWKEYVEYRKKNIPEKFSFSDFENSLKGQALRAWHFFTFGTETSWINKVQKNMTKKISMANEKKREALKEREGWLAPRISQLDSIKEEKIVQVYKSMLSRDIKKEVTEKLNEQKRIQKTIRNPENPTNN